jgi:RimJ/RimL family protein N-acetyltransferase
MTRAAGFCRLLEPEQHGVLAAVLPDAPHTVQSIHMLRRRLCRAYIAGDPARFDGAILQPLDWPEEPTGFGSDPELLWKLLQLVEGWTCILVDSECAPPLGEIIQAERGGQARYIEDVSHVLTEPVRVYREDAVRRLTVADLELLESTPLELRAGLWHNPRQLLTEGIIASAVVSGEIVATALVTAYTDTYAEIGVFTREDHRGHGYATAAASLVAQAVQEHGSIPMWGTGSHNVASLRVAQKLGFREVSRRTYVIWSVAGRVPTNLNPHHTNRALNRRHK